jgi:hypothetical protein
MTATNNSESIKPIQYKKKKSSPSKINLKPQKIKDKEKKKSSKKLEKRNTLP